MKTKVIWVGSKCFQTKYFIFLVRNLSGGLQIFNVVGVEYCTVRRRREAKYKKKSSFGRIKESFEQITNSFGRIIKSFERIKESFEQIIRFVRTNQ